MVHEQVDVVLFAVEPLQFGLEVLADLSHDLFAARQHRAPPALPPAQARLVDARAHTARTTWNLLHDGWTMLPKDKRTLASADAAIRQARKDIDWLAVLPAQAAQAVLKTYFQAWKNCWKRRAEAPAFKARFRSVMSVSVPQGRDLQIKRVHRRWGVVSIPKVGRVRLRWTKDLPIGKDADTDNKITGARLVKDALGWHIASRVQTLDTASAPHTGWRGQGSPQAPPRRQARHRKAGRLQLQPGEHFKRRSWCRRREGAPRVRHRHPMAGALRQRLAVA